MGSGEGEWGVRVGSGYISFVIYAYCNVIHYFNYEVFQ